MFEKFPVSSESTKAARIFWHSLMENSYKVQSEYCMKICYLTERLVSSIVTNAHLTAELAQLTAENARLKTENARLRLEEKPCEMSKLTTFDTTSPLYDCIHGLCHSKRVEIVE